MTDRMIAALASPHVDILGHCTGRLDRRARAAPSRSSTPSSCSPRAAQLDKAVEINSRPERLDPPMRLLAIVVELRVQGLDRHRRARDVAARLAALRLPPRGRGGAPDRADRQHLARRRPPRLDRVALRCRLSYRRHQTFADHGTLTVARATVDVTCSCASGTTAPSPGVERERAVDRLAVARPIGADPNRPA